MTGNVLGDHQLKMNGEMCAKGQNLRQVSNLPKDFGKGPDQVDSVRRPVTSTQDLEKIGFFVCWV